MIDDPLLRQTIDEAMSLLKPSHLPVSTQDNTEKIILMGCSVSNRIINLLLNILALHLIHCYQVRQIFTSLITINLSLSFFKYVGWFHEPPYIL